MFLESLKDSWNFLLHTKSESPAIKCRESLSCLASKAKILKVKMNNEHQALVIWFRVTWQADLSVIKIHESSYSGGESHFVILCFHLNVQKHLI